jgi:O-antigen/teichoic acid export membrane protein
VLGREALGQYGVLLLGGSALMFVPDVLTVVLWPFAGERYGRSGESRGSLAPVAAGTLRALAVVLAAVLVLLLQATEVLVATVLPAYRPALDALRWYLAGVFLLALASPLRLLLATAGADRAVLRAQAWVLAAAVVAEAAAALAGWGIAGVAIAGAAAAALLLSLHLRLVARFLGPGGEALRCGALGLALLAGALAVDRAIDRVGLAAGTPAGAAGRLAVPALALLAAGAFALRMRASLGASPESVPGAAGGGG